LFVFEVAKIQVLEEKKFLPLYTLLEKPHTMMEFEFFQIHHGKIQMGLSLIFVFTTSIY